jgi:predicted phage tail protein
MRRRVHLHGAFADFVDGPIEIVTTTIMETIEAVSRMVPGFQPDPIRGRKRVMVAGCQSREDLLAPSDMEDVHIFPAMTFGKNGGLLTVLSGIVQVVIGVILFFTPGLNLLGSFVIASGLLTIAGGMMQILAPQPKNSPETRSRYIATTQNTVAIGTPIPILYGRCKIGGQILSLSVTSQNQAFKT